MDINTTILNSDIQFQSLNPQIQRAFLGKQADKKLLNRRHLLYRFHNQAYLTPPITAWWSSVEPINSLDCGLTQLIVRANRLQAQLNHFARTQNAVSHNWGNSMTYLLTAELRIPAYTFVGRASHQLVDGNKLGSQNVFFIGGGVQLWIPNLESSHIQLLDVRDANSLS
jgi:hypothetical protein